MIRGRCALALLLVATLTACSQDIGGSGGASPTPGARVSVDATVSALAAAGVATVADESTTTPQVTVTGGTVFTVTRWQATNLAAEAAAGGGVTGSALDRLFPMPEGAPPIAYLIGAWVSRKSDPAETAAAALYGKVEPDWAHADEAVFPGEVIALFVADFVRAARSGAPSGDSTSALVQDSGGSFADQPCSLVSGFIDTGLRNIFEALKLDPGEVDKYVTGALGGGTIGQLAGRVAGLAASIWNVAVGFFETAAHKVLEQITAPFVEALQFVLGGLATFTMVLSYLKTQTAPVRAMLPLNYFGHGSEPDRTGTITVALDSAPDWPSFLTDCAKTVHVDLPTLSKPGMPVTWTLSDSPGALVTYSPSGVQPLGDDLTNRITYTTSRESDDLAEHGELRLGKVIAKVAVRRSEIGDLKDLIVNLAVSRVPSGPLRSLVEPIVQSWAEKIAAQFDQVTAVQGSTLLQIGYHVPKVEPCIAPTGTYSGPASVHVAIAMHAPVGGSGATIYGDGTAAMTGRLSVTYAGGKVTGTLSMSGTSVGHVLGSTDSNRGTMTGTISGPASAPTIAGVLASAKYSAPYQTSLHVTHADCKSVSGDLVAVIRDVYRSYGTTNAITISGKGDWTIPHS